MKPDWYSKLPDENQEFCKENLELFYATMRERMLIWKRRFIDCLPQPWTDNEILRDFKFTNVYRELDRNSQWQIKNILLDDTLNNVDLVWKLMVFRIFNNPETFQFFIETRGWRNGIPSWRQFNSDEFLEAVRTYRATGNNPFTNAYLVNSGRENSNRDVWYCKRHLPELHEKLPLIMRLMKTADNPKELIKFLTTLPSVANFIAHEYYQDMTYIAIYTDRNLMRFTQNDYTNVGPGASMGLRLTLPNLKRREQESGIYKLRDMAGEWLKKIDEREGTLTPFVKWDKTDRRYVIIDECNLTLHQIEMWLCEFQKYWKMIIQEGKQRSKFQLRTKELIVK